MNTSTRLLGVVLVIFLSGGAVATLTQGEWLAASVWGTAALFIVGFVLVWPWVDE